MGSGPGRHTLLKGMDFRRLLLVCFSLRPFREFQRLFHIFISQKICLFRLMADQPVMSLSQILIFDLVESQRPLKIRFRLGRIRRQNLAVCLEGSLKIPAFCGFRRKKIAALSPP